mgnify:CR=1 FL=1
MCEAEGKQDVGRINQSVSARLKKKWKTYIARLEQYFTPNGVQEIVRVPTLIAVVGDETYELKVDLVSPSGPATLIYDPF